MMNKILCEYSGNVVSSSQCCEQMWVYSSICCIYKEYILNTKMTALWSLGIPSRDFKQEFSEEAKVAEFCSTEYGVDFPMFATAKVKGKNAHPFYKKLIAASGKEPRWNFAKYLIGQRWQSNRSLQVESNTRI